jgi:hypothetical protein
MMLGFSPNYVAITSDNGRESRPIEMAPEKELKPKPLSGTLSWVLVLLGLSVFS